MVSNIFDFHPHLGKWSNVTSIFFGWVVQPPTSKPLAGSPDETFPQPRSGCLSMWWNCSRFKTAQRLVTRPKGDDSLGKVGFYIQQCRGIAFFHPMKTNMTMEKQAFEDVSPLLRKMMIFQPSMLVYLRVMPGCFINCEVYQQSLPIFFPAGWSFYVPNRRG